MESRKEQAAEKKRSGIYNCAQSVMCTYCDYAEISEDEARNLGNSFAIGMGNMEGTCGAVSGACALAGMKRSSGNLDAPNSKAKTYGLSREIVSEFKEQNGSVVCKELKGIGTGKVLRSVTGGDRKAAGCCKILIKRPSCARSAHYCAGRVFASSVSLI